MNRVLGRWNVIGVGAVAALLLGSVVAGCRAKNDASDRSCNEGTTAQAITAEKIRGNGLPPKSIALTFDDGPGQRTSELSHFLKAEGVPAAFFVNGQMLTNGGAILQELVADGHVIANHTHTHPNLTQLTPNLVVSELDRTDALIAAYVPDNRFMFRPPFGAYDGNTFNAISASPMSKYVGPVDWDMGDHMGPNQAADWDCWSADGSSVPPVVDVQTCANLYLAEIREKTSGIVLMHDPYFIDDDPAKGGTVDLVKIIVPILKAEGFTFVRVDNVPSVAAALPPLTTGQPVPGSSSSNGGTSSTSGASGSAAPGGTSSGSTAEPGGQASGGSTDPCTPSPQQNGTSTAQKRGFSNP